MRYMLLDDNNFNSRLNLFQLRFCLNRTLTMGFAGVMLWRSALAWGGSLFKHPAMADVGVDCRCPVMVDVGVDCRCPVMVDVGVNTDTVLPVVAAVRPLGVGVPPRFPGLLGSGGRGAAFRRIVAAMAHEREYLRGRLGDFD